MSWLTGRHPDALGWLDHLRRPDCHRVMQVLQQFLDGELGLEDAEFVEAHLAQCDRCGIEAATYRRVKQRLARLRGETDRDAVARLRARAEAMLDGPDGPGQDG